MYFGHLLKSLYFDTSFLVRGKQTSRAVYSPCGAFKGEMLNMFLNKWHIHYLFITSMPTEK